MPKIKIKLKQNSPEYLDDDKPSDEVRLCDAHECVNAGEHKAPKSREGNDYYFFCLEHAQDYNKSWNFFDGMSNAQIQEEMLRSLYGDRPTWSQMSESPTESLRRQAWQQYNFTDESERRADQEEERKKRANAFAYHHDSPEYQALALLGLEPPLDLDILKKRYKDLVKKHHPDRNQGDEKAEELLKQINMAYTILKTAFEKYEKLMDQYE